MDTDPNPVGPSGGEQDGAPASPPPGSPRGPALAGIQVVLADVNRLLRRVRRILMKAAGTSGQGEGAGPAAGEQGALPPAPPPGGAPPPGEDPQRPGRDPGYLRWLTAELARLKAVGLDPLLNSRWCFGLNRDGGLFRRWLAIGLAGGLWAVAAHAQRLPNWAQVYSDQLSGYILSALFGYPGIVIMAALLAIELALALLVPRLLRRPDFGRPLPAGSKLTPALAHQALIILAALLGAAGAFRCYLFSPPELPDPFVVAFLRYPFVALFAPTMLRRALVLAAGFYLAFRLAVSYLDDIFEINDPGVSGRFILQSAFASGYAEINIQEGAIAPEQRSSPVVKIGGPGRVRVHLENAALFETVEGRPHVLPDMPAGRSGPADEPGELSGFERLRAVVDLRDQEDTLTVSARTRDGIQVEARDVRYFFSVHRGGQPASLERPYPFDPGAVARLVYSQGDGNYQGAMKGLVRGQLVKFISDHTLSQFLAAIIDFDLTLARTREAVISQGYGEQEARPEVDLPEIKFMPRSEVTGLFGEPFARKAAGAGLELKWIGVGTWVLPDQVIHAQHLEAWKLSRDNLAQGDPAVLERLRAEAWLAELLRLLEELPHAAYQKVADRPPAEQVYGLASAYLGRLRAALRAPANGWEPGQRQRVERAAALLQRLLDSRDFEGAQNPGVPASGQPAAPPEGAPPPETPSGPEKSSPPSGPGRPGPSRRPDGGQPPVWARGDSDDLE